MTNQVAGPVTTPAHSFFKSLTVQIHAVERILDVPSPAVLAKLRAILEALDGSFVERKSQVRLALLAVLSGHHTVLLGPPGTAKSLLARAVCNCFQGTAYFEYLLSKFTHPDELFGPVSIPGLKEEDYRRITDGYLPQAHVVFLDEVFKANSAILNSLLTLINERIFHHGKHRDAVPLLGLIGASNEPPDPAGGLEALHDRFLVRLGVPPIGDGENFLAVCLGEVPHFKLAPEDLLSLEDVERLRELAAKVTADLSVRAALLRIRAKLAENHVDASDRRWRWAIDLVRMSAITSGRTEMSLIDLVLLEHCFSDPRGNQGLVRKCVRESLIDSSACGEYLQSPQEAWAALRAANPADGFSSWRSETLAALDRFDAACRETQARVDRHWQALQEEYATTPWSTEFPVELTSALVPIRATLQAYELASSKHRNVVGSFEPSVLLARELRGRSRERYYGSRQVMLLLVAGGKEGAIALDEHGLCAPETNDATAPRLLIDDGLAHDVYFSSDVVELQRKVLAAVQWRQVENAAAQPSVQAVRTVERLLSTFIPQLRDGLTIPQTGPSPLDDGRKAARGFRS